MKSSYALIIFLLGFTLQNNARNKTAETFPDGTKIPEWFSEVKKVSPEGLGKKFVITDFGVVNDSTAVQTLAIQKVIDQAGSEGGGVIVIPKGTFRSGALFFRPHTHLHVLEGAVLKGSDNIADYPLIPSRMEGQNLDYYAALLNAYGVDGFTISGKGTIDGNGLKYWEAFWQRRKENQKCTNLEVSRPRLLFVWNSNEVQVQDVKLHNSGFWTSHYYKCKNVKILDLHIFSPAKPVRAPSTDAIDLDVCSNVLIKGCYLSVNDDAIALKGGKGPWADTDPNNGENTNIIIENCEFGFCHSALTCGSEAIHNKNIVMRNCHVKEAERLLWLKMRPDTPQLYEYITVEHVKGQAHSMVYAKPWTQFFDLKGKKEAPLSYCKHITMRDIELTCDVFYDIDIDKHDRLADFTFANLNIQAKNAAYNKSLIDGVKLINVKVNDKWLK